MPKITSYTPAWLSKPNPGHDLFTPSPSSQSLAPSTKKNLKPGPRRTIAYRGVEVFIAVGKEIRWADLVYLREAWEDKEQKKKSSGKGKDRDDGFDEGHAQGYRVCFEKPLLIQILTLNRPSKCQSRMTSSNS
jgi:nucleoporin NUP82